ncbi:MAG: triose-phosphate isomerase [Candidatus Diapherotrites archaeon]
MKTPVLFINFKCYGEATGTRALELAKKAEAVAGKSQGQIALVVQAVDIRLVSEAVSLPVFAQHVDPVEYGSRTGHILPEAVKAAGAKGTVLNHAENKRDNAFLEKAIVRAHEAGLSVMVCAESRERAEQVAAFSEKPEFIAIEPPELIGGDISVSTAKPELITDTVKAVKAVAEIPVITGAGIKNAADVRIALKLGTKGVFVASGIIKSQDQEKAIIELVEGFR